MGRIAIFHGGKPSGSPLMTKTAADSVGIGLDLISYNDIGFDTLHTGAYLQNKDLNSYNVMYFRNTSKHHEEINLILDSINQNEVFVVDPVMKTGRPSDINKANQMRVLSSNGITVPKTLYGSLRHLRGLMALQLPSFQYPVVIKASKGARGERVFKVNNDTEMEALVRQLRQSEIEEGRRYLLQEFVQVDCDYRAYVLGSQVVAVMKRTHTSDSEFRNNICVGGRAEAATLPEYANQIVINAAKACGITIAGVDIAFAGEDFSRPVIWEVNKGSQIDALMTATGIDIPMETALFLQYLSQKQDSINAISSIGR